MDALFLSRLQFALTIGFHYIYPPITIGLGVILVVMEALFLKTRREIYRNMTRYWVRIFGLTFAIGVATGIVMEFEFGTNWETYSRYVGDVFGSALAAEGIFAFFVESGFLAVLLFGWDKVKPTAHFLSTVMVYRRAFQCCLDRGGRLMDADTGRFSYCGRRTERPRRDNGFLGHGI